MSDLNMIKPQNVQGIINKFCFTIGMLPTSYKLSLTYEEQILAIGRYLEETVYPAINNNAEALLELQNLYQDLKDYVDNYFEDLDIQDEINQKLDEMAEHGTLAQIIAEYFTNRPSGNTFSLKRIGRKINYGSAPSSSNHNVNGIASCLQGGTKINDTTIAYMLWDSLNHNLNKNKIILLNITNGQIIKQKDVNYGWCNSIAYNENILYIAERGTTFNDISTNNGIIKKLSIDTLEEIETLELPFNVNAISIFNNTLYVLEENTNTIHLYNLDGTPKDEYINLEINIPNIYNQNIKVTDKYIYLLSSKPNNILSVYNINGDLLKIYNIPKYGGIYKIGEVQFIDTLDNDDLIIGSTITNYEEFINQFFKINLTKNIEDNYNHADYLKEIYCDSDVDNFNPNGDNNNKFTSINEVDNLIYQLMTINGNNKNYKCTYISNKQKILLTDCNFTEGLRLQYLNAYIIRGSINYAINTSLNSCLYVRSSKLVINQTVFNANNNQYCISSPYDNIIKFVLPVFNNYTVDVFAENQTTSIIDVNNTNNLPFLSRLYNKPYNLFANGSVNIYKTGLIQYNTDLTTAQIKKIIDNCNKIIIGFNSLNKSCVQEIELEKNENNFYTITDVVTSSSSVNIRIAKMLMNITENGVNVTSSNVTQFANNAYSVTQADDSSSSELFLKIAYVKFVLR
jgi:hypothetical protein